MTGTPQREEASPAASAGRLCLIGLPHVAAGRTHALERKDAALLAVLALDGPSSRARIAPLLWPDAEPAAARGNLRQRLFRLRAALGFDVVAADAATLRIASNVEVDVHMLPRQLAADAQAGAGELLGAHAYDDNESLAEWVDQAREAWRNRRTEWLAQHASALETRREIAAALPYAQRLIDEEPQLEHGHRRLMRLHYLRGDRAAALAAYEHCRRVLHEAVAAAPSAETVRLAELIERSGTLPEPGPAPRPVSTLRPPRLVGRETEWRQLERGLASAGVVLVSGEPGIGKSRLLGDHVAHCDGATPLVAARPGDEGIPYAALTRLLRAAGSEGALPEPLDARRLLRSAAEVLAARGGLIALDDLHYADTATLELLPALVAETRARGTRWLLAVRAAEVPEALRGWLDGQDALTLPRVPLGPLTPQGVRALLESLRIEGLDVAQWAPALARHTGGNPLFILETLIALFDARADAAAPLPAQLPAPPQVGQLIERRLGQLGTAALRLARLAALAGQDFDAALAADILGRHPLDIADDWRELEDAQVLRDGGFAHDLIREATLRSVPEPIARLLHAQIAQRLEGHGGAPARIAAHWRAAGRWTEAAAQYLAAAATAQRASQRRLEAELLASAAECSAHAGDRAGEFSARERLFHALRYVARFDAQAAAVDALAALAGTPAERAAMLEARATLASDDQQDQACLDAAREAGALARNSGDRARALSVVRLEARALARMNRAAEAIELLSRHADEARGWRDGVLGARVLSDLGATLVICDRNADAMPLLDDALVVARALDDHGLTLEILQHRAWAWANLGETRRAIAAYEQARALRVRFEADHEAFGMHDTGLARHYKELGHFREALELLEAVRAWQAASGRQTIFTVADAELANCWLWLGQTARAAGALRDPAADAAPTVHAAHLVARARIALAQQQPAVELLRRAYRLCEAEGRAYYRLSVSAELSRALPPDEAAALALAALEESRRIGLHIMTITLTVRAADALRRAGRCADALPLARQIVAEFERWSSVALYGPEYAWIAWRCLEAAGDGAADEALRRGIEWIASTLPHVPAEFRESFLHRNPVNFALRAAAARRFGPDALAGMTA